MDDGGGRISMNRSAFGPLVKAKETVHVFARNAPSPRELLANRTGRFDELHAVLPSTATPGESLSLTVQAWDQCERLFSDFDGTVTVDATDSDATYPRTLSFDAADGGVVRTEDVRFETPESSISRSRPNAASSSSRTRFASRPTTSDRSTGATFTSTPRCLTALATPNEATDSAAT
ncbi:hypothetical protein ACFQJD_18520 [Haloplanus sp. GCM10025708]|uniref:hypothetical protein n=1 Tax=Haloplanus sp. GCM10025708 TaxID=3252679 RepID=UPI003611D57C